MTVKTTSLGAREHWSFLWKQRGPGTFLSVEELDSYVDLLVGSSVECPNHFAASLFVSALDADRVPDLEVALDVREQSSARTDIAGAGVLGEHSAVGCHTPDA